MQLKSTSIYLFMLLSMILYKKKSSLGKCEWKKWIKVIYKCEIFISWIFHWGNTEAIRFFLVLYDYFKNELTYFIIKIMTRYMRTPPWLQYKYQSQKLPKVRSTVKQRLLRLLWLQQQGENNNFFMRWRETWDWLKSHCLQKNITFSRNIVYASIRSPSVGNLVINVQ